MISAVYSDLEICNIYVIYNQTDREVIKINHYEEKYCSVGNVFWGRVVSSNKSNHSSFIDVGNNELCYLNEYLPTSKKILIQVVKEAIGTKKAVVKREITLESDSIILIFNPNKQSGCQIKYSKDKTEKLSPELENNILCKLRESFDHDVNMTNFDLFSGNAYQMVDIIIRSKEYSEKKLLDDLSELISKCDSMLKNLAVFSSNLIIKHDNFFDNFSGDLIRFGVTKIYSDTKKIKNLVKSLETEGNNISFKFVDENVLFNQSLMPSEIMTRNLFKDVKITVDEGEAFTMIDVDSGAFIGTHFEANKRAAKLILKEILRTDISGMIIIDFIDMNAIESKDFLDYLNVIGFGKSNEIKIMGFTKLGLLECTRKKTKKSIRKVLTKEYVGLLELLIELKSILKNEIYSDTDFSNNILSDMKNDSEIIFIGYNKENLPKKQNIPNNFSQSVVGSKKNITVKLQPKLYDLCLKYLEKSSVLRKINIVPKKFNDMYSISIDKKS